MLERRTTIPKGEQEKIKEILNTNHNQKMTAQEINIFKMFLNKGSFAGLEVIFKSEKRYDYTLKSMSNFNVIYKINLNDFPELKPKHNSPF